MLKRIPFNFAVALLAAAVIAIAAVATATVPKPSPTTTPPGVSCVQYTEIAAGTRIDTSPTLSMDQDNGKPLRPLVTLLVANVDANSSVTTWRAVCTVSSDGNTTDYTIQKFDQATALLSDDSTFDKTSPGSANWPISFDLQDMPDFECTFTAQAGAAAAADTLQVIVRMCVR